MGFLTRCKRPFLFAFLLQFCNMLFSFFLKTFLILFEKQHTLAENDQNDEAKEMCRRVIQCGSYDAALGVIGEYVNIVSIDEWDEPELNGMEY